MVKTKELCKRCRDDYYNHVMIKGCMHFNAAEIIQLQRVGMYDVPPYKWNPEIRLSCYSFAGGIMLPKEDTRITEKD